MADERVEYRNRMQTIRPKCSVCGARATGLKEDGSFDSEGRPAVEFSARCEAHMKTTEQDPSASRSAHRIAPEPRQPPGATVGAGGHVPNL